MKKIDNLQGLEKITELLKIVFASGYIKGEKPLSCILVAPVSSGKTIAVKQFKENKSILINTDSTAYGILRDYQNKLKNEEIRHIVIPDLLNALARRKSTAEQLLLFINASSEDGIFPSSTYGLTITDFIKPFGWVLCVTTDGFKKKYKFLKDIGFISRFFIIQYNYSIEQIKEILDNIINEVNITIPNIPVKTCKLKKHIEKDVNIFNEANTYAKLLCKDGESEVLRMQRNLQTFLKSSAYLRGDDKVKQSDLNKLKGLIDLIK